MSEKDLISAIKKGNRQAFRQVYDLYKDDIYRFSASFLKSKHGAEEIVQEVFIRLWEHHEKLDLDKSFKSYLFTIARNLTLNSLRKETRKTRLNDSVFFTSVRTSSSPEEQLLDKEYQVIKQDALEQLPPRCRIVFELCRIQGKSYKEISEELGISTSTVKNQMSKSLKILNKFLLSNQDTEFYKGSSFILFILLNLW